MKILVERWNDLEISPVSPMKKGSSDYRAKSFYCFTR
jgi:hypothetical protein